MFESLPVHIAIFIIALYTYLGVTCTAATASIADPTKPPEATAATPSGTCTVHQYNI